MQSERMDGRNTPCLIRGRFVVAVGEGTTHYDVIGSGAHGTPERAVSRFAVASAVPHLDPVGNVDKDACFELPDNDSGTRPGPVACRGWAEVAPALGNDFVVSHQLIRPEVAGQKNNDQASRSPGR